MKRIGIFSIIVLLFVPTISLAAGSSCSVKGYTVLTINGVFTDENGAKKNSDSLKFNLGDKYKEEKLTVDYLLNPSHLGGAGDILKSAYQKLFDQEIVDDYDLREMLKAASEKVTTQKLLLVAHSQGNFYANSFYDTVVGKDGGVPTQSIGVYSVANPAGRVAGNGRWLTSDTDKVIARLVARTPFKKIMPPNVHIDLAGSSDPSGHGFSEVYLKYEGARMIAGIEASLSGLTPSSSNDLAQSCLNPPKLTIVHKVEGALLAVADPVSEGVRDSVVLTAKVAAKTATLAYEAAALAAKTGAKVVVAVYQAGKFVGAKTVDATASAISSALRAVSLAGGSSALLAGVTAAESGSGISSVDTPAPVPLQPTPTIPPKNEKPATPLPAGPSEVKAAVTSPRIVLLRVSAPASIPVLELIHEAELEEEATSTASSVELSALPAPVVSVSQCATSLASAGCLLATTTVRFEWSPVVGASWYAVSRNGTYATTTDTTFNVTTPDFSDYTFDISAVPIDTGLQLSSATTTTTVSIATIPVAINEIAWMGTLANTADEWIELKNNSSRAIDLSGWTLSADDGAPSIVLSGTLAAHGYAIVERTDDRTIADVTAHTVYTGALSNSGEVLALSHSGITYDRIPSISGGSWAGGSNSSTEKETMERYNSLLSGDSASNWGTHLTFTNNGTDAGGNAIAGTPGARNSRALLFNGGRDVESDLTLSSNGFYYAIVETIEVSASSTLSIGPGVVIKFVEHENWWENPDLEIYGVMRAEGTALNPIVFETLSGTHIGNIVFDGGVGTSTLAHVSIENIEGIEVDDGAALEAAHVELIGSESGIVVEESSFTGQDLYIASTTNERAFFYDGSTVSISSSTITHVFESDAVGVYDSHLIIASSTVSHVEDGDGVGLYDSTASISDSSIIDVEDGDGIAVYDSTLQLASSTIAGVHSGNGVSSSFSTITIASSTLSGIVEDGVSLFHSDAHISNTTISGGSSEDVGVNISGGTTVIESSVISGFTEGAGVDIWNPATPVQISNTEITGNAEGVRADEADSVVITPESLVHDNGTTPADNIVVEE